MIKCAEWYYVFNLGTFCSIQFNKTMIDSYNTSMVIIIVIFFHKKILETTTLKKKKKTIFNIKM